MGEWLQAATKTAENNQNSKIIQRRMARKNPPFSIA
jgi:hypothetical protein